MRAGRPSPWARVSPKPFAELLERLFALEFFGIKLGLENILQLCAALDHPERTFVPLHIAGTNGKGSVTAMVDFGSARVVNEVARAFNRLPNASP